MGAIDDSKAYALLIRESANDGSDFTNPAADYRRLFLGEDGLLHVKDSAGTVTDPFSGAGSVATDAIWDAAGDLVQGTGANTAAKLGAGTAGQFLKSGGAATANAWASRELDYVAPTSTVSVIATAAASATTIITGNAVAYDGSTAIIIEFFCADADFSGATAADLFILYLYDGASEIGFAAVVKNSVTGANAQRGPIHASVRITPSAATHTYSWRGTVTNASRPMAIGSGAGSSSGVRFPMYLRITRAL